MHVISSIQRIQSGAGTDKRSIIVNGNFVINPVRSYIIVFVICIRAAYQCTVKNMSLFCGIFTFGQSGRSAMVRIFCRIFIVTHNIGTIHRVFPQDVFHLSLCPFAEFAGLAVIIVLIIDQRHELCCGVIPCRTPGVQPEVAAWCDCAYAAGHIGIYCLGNRCPAVHLFIGTLVGSLLVFIDEIRILLISNFTQNTLYTAPDIVPAMYITRSSVVVIVRVNLFQVMMIFCNLVEPCSCPAVVIFPFGGGVILFRAVCVVT